MADPPPVFEVEGVSYRYLNRFTALDGVSLRVMPGERIAILGANGSGKSTLLKVLAGLAWPQAGTVRFRGQPVSAEALGRPDFQRAFRQRVGLVFQDSDVQLFCPTARDEIAFGPVQLELAPDQVQARVADLLRMLRIEPLADRAPYHLSGGEKKKVAIASVLALGPEVLLLDEPTDGLDPRTQYWLVEMLRELAAAGQTIVTATHHLEVVAAIAERIVVMAEDHTIRADGPAAEVLHRREVLLEANLIHEHLHWHGTLAHSHPHEHVGPHAHHHGPESS